MIRNLQNTSIFNFLFPEKFHIRDVILFVSVIVKPLFLLVAGTVHQEKIGYVLVSVNT